MKDKTFGFVKVLSFLHKKKGHRYWQCLCLKCDRIFSTREDSLVTGNTKSCGCIKCKRKLFNHYRFDFKKKIVRIIDQNDNVALVDLKFFYAIKDYYWLKNKRGYFENGVSYNKRSALHRFIWHIVVGNLKIEGFELDHINRKKYDNRLENLRYVTRSENMRNRGVGKNNITGCKGVVWHVRVKKYQVSIGFDKKRKYLGYADTFEEALKLRAEGEEKYWGCGYENC